MQIDTSLLGIIVTVLLAIITLAAWLGALSQKVRQHEKAINDANKASETMRTENRTDHQLIFQKLEEINKFIRNGMKS